MEESRVLVKLSLICNGHCYNKYYFVVEFSIRQTYGRHLI